jgi:NDP-mannose synthase
LHAIILAGGKGTRLGALTRTRPKSLTKLGDHSILEIITRQLRNSGFDRLTLCVSHLGELIVEEFGDGSRFGITIDYSWDHSPLGTAAPLRLISDWASPALVMNGDILTALDFEAFFSAHLRRRPAMTVATLHRRIQIDYGVLDLDGDGQVRGVREKPSISMDVSSGIYVIDPGMRAHSPAGRRMDMPELVATAVEHGLRVQAYAIAGPWHDIGNVTDYRSATRAFLAHPATYVVDPEPAENASRA